MRTLTRAGAVVALALSCSILRAAEAEKAKPEIGTVTEKGLCMTAKPTKDAFAATEAMTFDVTLKNVSDKAFGLYDPAFVWYEVNAGTWNCVLVSAEDAAKKYQPMAMMRPMVMRIPAVVSVGPGKTHSVKISLTKGLSYRPVVEEDARFKKREIAPLPEGKYTLELTANFREGKDGNLPEQDDNDKTDANCWTGALTVKTAAFQFGGEAKVEAGAGGWSNLFADEDWYKNQKGQERLFTGVLNAIKQDPNVETTLQRTSLYSLDKRTIYTGAKQVDALDKLVGKVVSIRGKTYDVKLEGTQVREIWPGAVREVKEPLHPIEVHPKPIDPPANPAPPEEGDKMDKGGAIDPPRVMRPPIKAIPLGPIPHAEPANPAPAQPAGLVRGPDPNTISSLTNDGKVMWRMKLPFPIGAVIERDGKWIISAADGSGQATVDAGTGKLIESAVFKVQ